MEKSSGLVIIQDNKILVVHPAKSLWKGTFSFPKGHIEKWDSTHLDTAIRETNEETGLNLKKSDLIYLDEGIIDYINIRGKISKKVFYFVVKLNGIILPEVLEKSKLQTEEVDWAGFLGKEDLEEKLFWRLKEIIKFINV